MHLEVFLAFRLDHVKELLAVFLVDESIVEDPVNLVAPKPDQLVRVSKVGAVTHNIIKAATFYFQSVFVTKNA